MNPTLSAVHEMVAKKVFDLSAVLRKTTDPQRFDQLSTEIQELVHRVNILQNLLFAKASAELEAKLPKIKDAEAKLAGCMANLDNIVVFVTATTAFLVCVDEAIDLAKTLG